MPQVNNPNAFANSAPGLQEKLRQQLRDLKGASRNNPFSMVIGLGGLVVNGVAQFVGGVLGPLVVNGAISATASVAGASGIFSSSLSSVGAYNTDVTLLAGARQTVWQHNSGIYGFAPSSITTKTNLKGVPFTAADVRAVSPFVFQYKAQIAIRDDPENEQYNPDYVVPWEIGLMAEHLIKHNMGCFVFWDEDGNTPRGINYDLFGAIAPLVVLADQEARLKAAGL